MQVCNYYLHWWKHVFLGVGARQGQDDRQLGWSARMSARREVAWELLPLTPYGHQDPLRGALFPQAFQAKRVAFPQTFLTPPDERPAFPPTTSPSLHPSSPSAQPDTWHQDHVCDYLRPPWNPAFFQESFLSGARLFRGWVITN